MADVKPLAEQGIIERKLSRIRQFHQFSQCLDLRKPQQGLRSRACYAAWTHGKTSTKAASEGWAQRGFNGIFVAGMHFMDAHSYNLRRFSAASFNTSPLTAN